MKKRKFSEGLFDVSIVLNALSILPGQTILDAGCGNGYMSRVFAKQVGKSGKVYALDVSTEFASTADKEPYSEIIEFIKGDITQKNQISDSCIDLIYLSTVFHIFSFQQIDGFEKEAKRLVKSSSSKIAIVNIHKKDTPFGPPIEMRSSPEELCEKLSFRPLKLIDLNQHFYMQLFTV